MRLRHAWARTLDWGTGSDLRRGTGSMGLSGTDIAFFKTIVEGGGSHADWRDWLSANAGRLARAIGGDRSREVARTGSEDMEAVRDALGAVLDREGVAYARCRVPVEDPIGAPEYEVLSALIASLGGDSPVDRLVIRQMTTFEDSMPGDIASARRLMLGMRGLGREAVDDYLARNQAPARLRRSLGLRTSYHLLNREEGERIFGRPQRREGAMMDGWERYRATFPRSSGIITLSRVGFGEGGNQALAKYGELVNPTMGRGDYFTLRRDESGWSIVGRAWAWIS